MKKYVKQKPQETFNLFLSLFFVLWQKEAWESHYYMEPHNLNFWFFAEVVRRIQLFRVWNFPTPISKFQFKNPERSEEKVNEKRL